MDGGAAAATIEVLIQNLIDVSKEEISLIRGVEKDADKLKEALTTIQSFLNDADKKFIVDDSVKGWLRKLEAAAFDADNILDELSYHVLSKKMKKMKKKVPSFFPSFNHYVRRRKMGVSIKEINMTFESIKKDAMELGLESRLANAPAALDAGSAETDSVTVDPIFIGRDDDVSQIVEMLTQSPIVERVLSILPIVGMGGLGKTTLTRNVFNHEKITTHFGERIWVYVPTAFDPVILLKKTLATLTSENVAIESREVLLKKLREALKEKTFLLVLDDVWNQDLHKWEGFINSLSGITSTNGNGIIVTTRNTEVASIVQTLHMYELRGLPDDSCWSIIKAKAFGEGDAPPGFEAIGRDIAKRCRGLPLAANVVGAVLRGKSDEDWLSIKENWLSDVEGHENNISKILKWSFDNLSSPSLKKCFAYCSIFTKGEKINKQQLIELWMAEGFLQLSDQTSDMETVGDKFFNLLLQNSLLQVVDRDGYGNVAHCSMHDLVHDVACSVFGSSKVNYNVLDGIHQARYIRCKCNIDEPSPVAREQAKCLRTLCYEGGIPSIMFSDFKSLHVLTLIDYDVEELPDSIRELIHLRFLDISATDIEYLPDSIGELHHLQTLRTELRKMPSTLKCLVNLRHLHFPVYTELPAELGMLTHLRTLPYFKVGDEEGYRIVELGSLKNLKGKLRIDNLEKVQGEEEAKKARLFQKPNIVKLALRWDESREGEIKDEYVLEGLQPHPNLKMLKINGFKGKRFPLWTLNMAIQDGLKGHSVQLDNLMEIKLSSCEECEEIPMLGHLRRLKYLHLCGMRKVKSIGCSFYGIDSSSNVVNRETIIAFPALRRFNLLDMPNLEEWVQVDQFPSAAEVKVFPCLEHLQLPTID